MNGADALIRTLADCGIQVCFANPGTSEMHLVAALDREPRIRPVLCLFEGVATGAADGFARMAGRPAMTLLHLGPGYLNGAANLHNARRAFVPAVNVIGDHATFHRDLDAPLTSDIEALVAPLAAWTGTAETAADSGPRAAAAYAASFGPPAGNAFLLLPADAAWNDGGAVAAPLTVPVPRQSESVDAVARAIRKAKKPAILLNGDALLEPGLTHAARLHAAGVLLLTDTFSTRQRRGGAHFAPVRLPYFGEQALEALQDVDLLVTAGTKHPVAFFAYPGKPSELTPKGARRLSLGGPEISSAAALEALAGSLRAPAADSAPAGSPATRAPSAVASATAPGTVAPAASRKPPAPCGTLTPEAVAVTLARHLPEDCIVADDSVTAGLAIFPATAAAAPHDWLFHTGGAIGQGLPLAVGAAIGAPGRKVVAVCGDGAAMYTVQSLWTMARERLDITVVVVANRLYRILMIELARTGAGQPGAAAGSLLSLGEPALDWVKMAEAHGVEAVRTLRAEDFDREFARLAAQRGPALIEAVV
jgi:acetolactate synthase-1/2/3 large subunit